MRRVALIYNPASGQHSRGRRTAIAKALAVLREAGVEAEALETLAPGSAGRQAARGRRARTATRSWPAAATAPCTKSCNRSSARRRLWAWCRWARPMPSPPTSAWDHPRPKPSAAARGSPCATRGQHLLSRRGWAPRSRYFTVAAGVGADALFMSRLDPRLKRRFGYALYLVEGFASG